MHRHRMRPLAPVLVLVLGVVAFLAAGEPARTGSVDPAVREQIRRTVMEELGLEDARLVDLAPIGDLPDRLEVDLGDAEEGLPLELDRRSFRSPGFRLLVQDAAGEIAETPAPAPRTYRGGIEGESDSRAALSVTPGGELDGVFERNGELFAVQPTSVVVPAAPPGLHVVFRVEDSYLLEAFDCGVPDLQGDHAIDQRSDAQGAGRGTEILITEIAFDADVQFFQLNGSSVPNTIADIEAVMNGVTLIYERDTEITYTITTVIVRTSEPDPYTTNDPGGLLGQFSQEWNQNQQEVQRDVAHLMTGRNLSGSVIGIASLGVICNIRGAYGLSQSRFTSNMSFRVALTAHELGHNWDSPHCSGADCRIMCPGLGGCTGDVTRFGAFAIGAITNHRNTRDCLDPLEDPLPLPFVDTFQDSFFDDELWSVTDRAASADFATNEPTEPFAMNLDSLGPDPTAQDLVVSKPLLLGGQSNVTLSFFTEAVRVEAGESLFVEYLASDLQWSEVTEVVSDGQTEEFFRFRSFDLTGDALHDEFRVRFRPQVDGAIDDWFVDNVSICAATVLASVTPQSTSVAAGSPLFFDASATNVSGQSQPTEAWVSVFRPDSGPLFSSNPKFGPKSFSLNPGQSRSRNGLRINVPGGATPGAGYRVIVFIGDFDTGEVCHTAEFEFTVTP